MIVDAHHHLWRPAEGYGWLDEPALAPIRRDFTPADLARALTAAGVDRTILVEGGRCDTAEAAVLLGHARDVPAIAGVVAWADLADPDLPGLLAHYRALPGGDRLVGIRSQVQAEPDPDYLARPEAHAGLRAVATAGLVFDLVIRADQLPAAASAAAAVPQALLVLDHLGKPRIRAGSAGHDEWAGPLAALAAWPNVSAKLSGLVTEADWAGWTVADLRPFVATAVASFGPRRLMFGSDWPVCLLAAPYPAVPAALAEALPPLPAGERAEIFGGTATRIYGLDRQR